MTDIEGILETGGALGVELAASALEQRGQKPGICANCRSPLIGPYCAVCGQERDTHRRSVFALVHDLVVDIVSFDSRILRTGRALLFQPGELSTAFRDGRTRTYVPAVRLYLFVSLIFFLVLNLTGLAILQMQVVATPQKIIRDAKGNAFIPNPAYDPEDANDPDMKRIPRLLPISKERANQPGGVFDYSTEVHFFAPIGEYHSLLSRPAHERLLESTRPKSKRLNGAERDWMDRHVLGSMEKLVSNPAALNAPLTTWIPRVLFLLLPLYALLLEIFYIRQRKKYFFVDHLIFSLGIHTFAFVALMAAAGLAQILSGGNVAMLTLGAISLYIFIAMKRFYRQGWFWTTVKFVTVSFIYTLFFLLPALGGVIALSVLQM